MRDDDEMMRDDESYRRNGCHEVVLTAGLDDPNEENLGEG